MSTIKKWIRDFFGFSSTEINGFLILVPLMVLLIASEPLYRMWISHREPDFGDTSQLDSLVAIWQTTDASWKKDTAAVSRGAGNNLTSKIFDFDPNKISIPELEALGFTKILAKRIASYRQKGGQFRNRDDLKKIYGVDTALYLRLYSHILLPERVHAKTFKIDSGKVVRNNLLTAFDLNTADSAKLESVRGIGPKLALRILKFRDKLGGFVSIKQLKEVYGLDSIVIGELTKASFITSEFVPKKINLNTATEYELSQHPYITRNIARSIVSFRFQHGPFNSVDDLSKMTQIKSSDVERIIPYLTLTR